MSHPSEYFIKFTLAQAWSDDSMDVTLHTLSSMLNDFGLPEMFEEQYDLVRAKFEPPEDFDFNDQSSAVTKQFMVEEALLTLWEAKEDEERVLEELIGSQKILKRDLHLLLLGRVPYPVVVKKLNLKYAHSTPITERMVETYQHFFWNVNSCTHEDWDKLLTGALDKDSCMAALYCGPQQALYRAGFAPKVEGEVALKEAYRQAFFRLEALKYMPDSRDTIDSFAKLTARFLNLHDVIYSAGTGLQDQLRQFRQIMMTNKDANIPAIDSVIAEVGSYSGDGDD